MKNFSDKQLLNTTYYLKTHTRAPAWLIGFLCGVLINNHKNRPRKLHKTQICGLWCVSVATLFTCSFGGYYTLRTFDYKRFENAFYLALNRPAFAVALCWVIFACVFHYGGKKFVYKKNAIFSFTFFFSVKQDWWTDFCRCPSCKLFPSWFTVFI